MPNQPKTPLRSLRVDDALWDEAVAIAKDRGESVSEDVLRSALRRYVAKNRRRPGEKRIVHFKKQDQTHSAKNLRSDDLGNLRGRLKLAGELQPGDVVVLGDDRYRIDRAVEVDGYFDVVLTSLRRGAYL